MERSHTLLKDYHMELILKAIELLLDLILKLEITELRSQAEIQSQEPSSKELLI